MPLPIVEVNPSKSHELQGFAGSVELAGFVMAFVMGGLRDVQGFPDDCLVQLVS